MDRWLLGFSFVSGGDPVLVWHVFDVFWGLHWVSLGFPWSSCWKIVNCWFWRTSGRLRGDFRGGFMVFGVFFCFLG